MIEQDVPLDLSLKICKPVTPSVQLKALAIIVATFLCVQYFYSIMTLTFVVSILTHVNLKWLFSMNHCALAALLSYTSAFKYYHLL